MLIKEISFLQNEHYDYGSLEWPHLNSWAPKVAPIALAWLVKR